MYKGIPRPACTFPVDKDKYNLLTCIDKLEWSAPSSLPKTARIKQAVYHGNEIYAIDEKGKLVLGPKNTVEFFKDKTLIQIDYLYVEYAYFVTETTVYNSNTLPVPFFEADIGNSIRELKCGAQHGYIITSKSIYSFGNSSYGQRMSINAVSGIDLVPELYLTDTIFTGGWNTYILRQGIFYGWGYNQVRIYIY
jgi:hypothetical protein